MLAIGLNPFFALPGGGVSAEIREQMRSPEAVLRRHGLVPFAQKWLVLRHVYNLARSPEERIGYWIDFNLRTVLWSLSAVILALSYFIHPGFFFGFAPLAWLWSKSMDRTDPDQRRVWGWKFRFFDGATELDRVWRTLPQIWRGKAGSLPPPAHFRTSMERALRATREIPGSEVAVLTYELDPILLIRVPRFPGLGSTLSYVAGHRTFYVDFYGTGLMALDAHHLNR